MRWECERGCGAGGSKTYETAAQANHIAVAVDGEDRDDVGRRAPWIAMFPLRLWHKLRERSERSERADRSKRPGRPERAA